jgi:hypothetical protein
MYRFVWPTGWTASLTPAQFEALTGVAKRWNLTHTVEVQPMFGGGGAVVVNVGSMHLAVETDGHVHS